MSEIADIIDRATVPADKKIVARTQLFAATRAEGDNLYERLTQENGADLVVVRAQPLELLVSRPARAWSSVDAAFAAAREIASAYGLQACEPDIAIGVMPVDPGRASERHIEESADTLSRLCWAPEEQDLRDKKRWAISAIKADKAWNFAVARGRPSEGAGIVIAQPDTGLTDHSELHDIALRAPINLLGDGTSQSDVTDPMAAGRNPGHGTATASVVVSRDSLDIIGSAPAAILMPIRAIETVVQPSMVKVAEAVDHAVAEGAHVITMSLGGIWSYSLWRAIERAVAADVIVMAAAGNCVRLVVWPAQFESCIAVAGVDQNFAPWRGTSRGSAVDISAPAQNVYRANAETETVGQGQGTSFAVALTAGVAACWLAFHGRANLIAAAHERDETLQAMFRRLVQASAHRPSPDWDEFAMGPGAVDAEALLQADLDFGRETEGPVRLPPPRDPSRSLRMLAAAQLGASTLNEQVDWLGRGGEISLALVRDDRQADLLGSTLAAPALRRPLGRSGRPGKVERLRNQIAASESVATGASRESVRALESAGDLSLTTEMADNVMQRVTGRAREMTGQTPDPQAFEAALEILQRYGAPAVHKLTGLAPGELADLSRDEEASLEAIVIADGSRPSFLLDDGAPPTNHPFMGTWDQTIGPLQAELATLAQSVGRIQPTNGHNGRFVGTGVLVDVGAGRVLTNYHVLDDASRKFLVPIQRTAADTIRVLGGLEIDFFGEASSFKMNRFKIVEAKLHSTSGRGFGRLDAVTLTISPIDGESKMPKKPIVFSSAPSDFMAASGQDLCTIGFPGPPIIDTDPSGRVDWDFVIKTLFGGLFGVKRLAPGRVILTPGSVERDPIGSTFGHDATTFGGASGSAVFAWGAANQPAIGLHFAGDTEISNYALASPLVANELQSIGVPII